MHALRAALMLALVAAVALADDPPGKPADAPKTVPEAAWLDELADVEKSKLSTVDRVKKLRALCMTRLIERQGKIRDIRGMGEAIEFVVCGIHGGPDLLCLVVVASDKPAVAKWALWDRLTWQEIATVDETATVSYQRQDRTPADFQRRENPGVEWVKLDDAAGSATYVEWVRELMKYCLARKFDSARNIYASAARRPWVFSGVVQSYDPSCSRACVDLEAATYLRDAESMSGWGIASHEPRVDVRDPQLASFLEPGSKVDVVLDLGRGAAAEKSALGGRFTGYVWVWRFTGGIRKK